MTKANPAPLIDAVVAIFRIADRNEREAEKVLEQLNEIIEVAEAGKAAYRDNFMAAQKAELEELRAAAKSNDAR